MQSHYLLLQTISQPTMPQQENKFTRFKQSIDSYEIPERFTFPFFYQPHPLSLLAAKELQHHLKHQQDWQHDFGITAPTAKSIGKMFGILLVRNKHNEIGYLSAFSGKLADSNQLDKFVPPIFDLLAKDSFFLAGQKKINQWSQQIELLELDPQIDIFKQQLTEQQQAQDVVIKQHRQAMIEGRKHRKIQRLAAEKSMSNDEYSRFKQQLGQQSIQQKNQLRDLTLYWEQKRDKAQNQLEQVTAALSLLKQQRKNLSHSLQQQIFDQYHFLNIKGQTKNVVDIFEQEKQTTPPAAAGECAAPKLLHYAFQMGMTPLAMAEFWWGASPKSAIRKHQNFYPACQGKCKPILKHMLDGMLIDDNPLLRNPAIGKTIDILYEDDVMVVINKPADFLSVPGKTIKDCVELRMQQRYPSATGSLIVHRLDMSTSGLMLIALTKMAHKKLQQQFIQRTIKKRYIALLEGSLSEHEGEIDLPIRVDLDDRPRQLVCYQYGKNAVTKWQLIERYNNRSKVYFYPITGRTHQLRVHSAHINGLNSPILGDDLYGNKDKRLHLHAESIEFEHPVTKQAMKFQLDAEF